jgi:hypothetical protein
MGLFGPPNIEKLKAKKDIYGLLKALEYRKKSDQWIHFEVRGQAAQALGELLETRAVGPLIAALNDVSGYVSKAAAKALVMLYRLGKLDDVTKKVILTRREQIISHTDTTNECSFHTDFGIGVDFPL